MKLECGEYRLTCSEKQLMPEEIAFVCVSD